MPRLSLLQYIFQILKSHTKATKANMLCSRVLHEELRGTMSAPAADSESRLSEECLTD